MLMSAQYHARNNRTTINQPIYVDFKTGNIYLWADNFALLTSEFADDKLGTQWQNKWLRLALDDGSLPKGFGKSVIKAHFEALDRTYEAAPESQFDYIAPTTLATLSPKLPTPQLNTMQQTPQIIRRVQSAESYEQFYKDYVSIFYERMTNQYPELIKEAKAYEPSAPRPDATKLTSKVLVQQALSLMKNVTDQLLYGAYITDKPHYQFFDENFEKLFRKIQSKLNVHESELGINDYNKEMTKFIVSVSSDTVYGKYYYYDSTTDELTELATLSPWLNPNELAEMHPIIS